MHAYYIAHPPSSLCACYNITHKEGTPCYCIILRTTKALIVNMYMCKCHFFFYSGAPLRARTFTRTSDGVGTTRPMRSRCRRFGRDPCSVSRVACLLHFLAWGTDKANPWGCRDGVAASPIPVYARKNWMQIGFSARGYTYISLFLHRAPGYDPAAQQQSSPPAATAYNSSRVWLLL